MRGYTLVASMMVVAVAAQSPYVRSTRKAIPQELYRDHVEPSIGGKVPEAAHMRLELNKLDAAGLESGEGVRMMEELLQSDIVLPEKMGDSNSYNPGKFDPFRSFFPESEFSTGFSFNPPFDSFKTTTGGGSPQKDISSEPYNSLYESDYDDYDYNPGYSPPLKLKPDYVPEKASYAPEKPSYTPFSSPGYNTPAPYTPPNSYNPEPYQPEAYNPRPYQPEPYNPNPYQPDSYNPEPYQPESYNPEPYAPAEPAYHKPVGPVLLEKRPHEVKSVQALPITVSEAYTSFDCRSVPYPDRHYADQEAGCEIYHFCHADGKQDTFRCGYGTVFNEYLGTCDYKNNVHCGEKVDHVAPHHAAQHPVHHAAHAPVHHAAHAPVHHAPSSQYHDARYHDFGGSFGGFNK